MTATARLEGHGLRRLEYRHARALRHGFRLFRPRRQRQRTILRVVGWIAILGAGGATVAALLRIAATGDVQAAESIFLVSSLLLTMWTLSMGILMWHRSADGGA